MPTARPTPRESTFGWVVSLLFWACLLVAVALFAMSVLAPKLLAYWELESEHRENQIKLVKLERQVEYFDKIASALETDAEFARELARFEFDAFRPGEERIAVDRRLSLQAPRSPVAPSDPTPAPAAGWFVLPVRTFVDDRQNTKRALLTAAVLVIFAFAFLQEPSRPATAGRSRRVLTR